jgi:RimJ/RimL family protein N-acetyltransferase
MYKFYGYGNWMVCLKENDKIIGRAGLTNREIDGENSVEVGYMIDVAYQKQGYATEIICGILEFAKRYLCLERIRAVIQKDNQISIALIEKLGFLHEFEYEDYVVYYKVLTRKEANYEDDNE